MRTKKTDPGMTKKSTTAREKRARRSEKVEIKAAESSFGNCKVSEGASRRQY